jgi:hypothetical protein
MTVSADPGEISVIAVHADDVVTALEANERDRAERRSVLRVTPPYSGRMRARLHREGHEEYDPTAGPIHLSPADLVDDRPVFPTPDETEDELRQDPGRTYSREVHREYHERRVAEWRSAVQSRIRESATLDTERGPLTVEVSVLGGRDA